METVSTDEPIIKQVSIAVIREHAAHLSQLHYKELGMQQFDLDVDYDALQVAENNNALLCIAAWVGNEMVGYSVNTMQSHPFYGTRPWCHHVALFVHPQHRTRNIGRKILLATESWARAYGCGMQTMHTKQSTTLELMLPRMGYTVLETVWNKEL
jgi:GNAT superfamily N-acetyltransferase